VTDLSFAISAITEIVHILATESGTIVERLLRTAAPLAELDADRVPEQIRDEHQQILEDIRKPPADAAADEPEAIIGGLHRPDGSGRRFRNRGAACLVLRLFPKRGCHAYASA
jgi:hypothetical protein